MPTPEPRAAIDLAAREIYHAPYMQFTEDGIASILRKHFPSPAQPGEEGDALPPAKDFNVESLVTKHRDRDAMGLAKYGVTTERSDLSTQEWLVHLQEELMDAAVYIQRLIGGHDCSEVLKGLAAPSPAELPRVEGKKPKLYTKLCELHGELALSGSHSDFYRDAMTAHQLTAARENNHG